MQEVSKALLQMLYESPLPVSLFEYLWRAASPWTCHVVSCIIEERMVYLREVTSNVMLSDRLREGKKLHAIATSLLPRCDDVGMSLCLY